MEKQTTNSLIRDMEHQISKIEGSISFSKILGIVTAIAAVALAFYPALWFGFSAIDYNDYGDYVGGVSGSLLSLAAMIFLYMTFLIQKKQIIIQQLQLNKLEAEHKRTEDRLNVRDFEERFFRLIQMFNENLRSIDLRKDDEVSVIVAVGKDSFKTMFNKFKDLCDDHNFKEQRTNNRNMLFADVIDIFRNRIHPLYENDLDSYFKYLGLVLEYIDSSSLVTNKNNYSDLIRDQLSTYELLILYYMTKVDDVHLSNANIRLKNLLIRYNILEHVDQNKIVRSREV